METYFLVNEQTEECIVQPHELENVQENINVKLKNRIGTCTKEDGFICDVRNIELLKNSRVSRISGDVFFTVKYESVSLKPSKGHIYHSTIIRIFDEGFFCQFKNIRIFVPNTETMQHKVFNVGDTMKVEITNIRYEDRQYQCIGHYLEE